jgi:putative membrane protein
MSEVHSLHGWGMGYGWLILVLLVLLFLYVFKNEKKEPSAKELLDRRFANGEISADEYHKALKELEA